MDNEPENSDTWNYLMNGFCFSYWIIDMPVGNMSINSTDWSEEQITY